jgi:ATP-binding cassette subfamily B protein
MDRVTARFAKIIGYLPQYRKLILWGLLSLVMTDVLSLIPPWLVKQAIDALPFLDSPRLLLPYLGAIVLVVSCQALFRFSWRRSLFGVARRTEYHLRNDLFAHLQKMDRAFFLRRSTGDLMSRCTNDLVAIQEVIAYFGLLIVDSSLTIATCLILMGIIDLPLTLASLIPLPLLSVCFFYFGGQVRRRSARVQAELAHLTQVVQETLTGIRITQAYNLESVRRDLYRDAAERYIRTNIQLANLRGLFYSLLSFLTGIAAVVVLWMGGTRVVAGSLTLGGFVAFNTYLVMLSWPMMSLGFMVNLLQRGRASMERLEEILRETPAVADAHPTTTAIAPADEMRFCEVGFRYPGTGGWALRGISLAIPRGSRMAITGPVGSGKSTLLELIPRIHDPQEGRVSLNGQDLREIPLADLRRRVGWVAQEPFLFSESIAANLAFGVPRASCEEVDRGARLVRLDKDLDAFPLGWDTVIGERGVMLSGGQRQRVALGRAIMVGPGILLMDDAFAHLDGETEAQVMRNVLEALPGATIIFTSHRVSTLLQAGTVVVLAEGRILEVGPPELLRSAGGYFQRICRQQDLIQEMEGVIEVQRP